MSNRKVVFEVKGECQIPVINPQGADTGEYINFEKNAQVVIEYRKPPRACVVIQVGSVDGLEQRIRRKQLIELYRDRKLSVVHSDLRRVSRQRKEPFKIQSSFVG